MYSKENPFMGTLVDRYSLCDPHSDKQTYHVVVSLDGSGLTYKVGDSFGFIPQNGKEEVEKLLSVMGTAGGEVVEKKGEKMPFATFLLERANLAQVSKPLYKKVGNNAELLLPDNRDALKTYLESRHIWDFLEENGAAITPQELVDCCMPLLPRFYSVASAQSVVGEEVHFTVADVEYESNGQKRHGVGSLQICHLLPLHEKNLPLYVQPAHAFSLTEEDDKPIIMIGPGTGVAPFRAFMQEREARGAKGKSWLFFGERKEKENYYYQGEWEEWVEKGLLKLTCAFSRDQQHKIYVQHRMKEQAEELWEWMEEGAYIYVCGDAHRMAKSVEAVLLEIIEEKGKCTQLEAKERLKSLRKSGKYQRDVY